MNYRDVMIDFETLGTNKDKCLCQVGAVYFDNVTGELGDEFKANIDATTHEKYGGRLDARTVYWWLQQSEAARASITAPGEDIMAAMARLNQFLAPATRIWSHATFDFVTLVETLKQLDITPAFSYKTAMDIRTLVYLAGTSTKQTPREGTHHDGLEDAKHQVKYCVEALNTIRSNKKIIAFINKLT